MAQRFDESNFEAEVLKSEIPVMVDFYADWCGPCQMMAPLVDELAHEYEGKIKIGKLNIDENMEIAQKYKVMSIPTFMIFKDGADLESTIGGVPKQKLVGMIEKVI